MKKAEHCAICDNLTGNAGLADDSISIELLDSFSGYKTGDIIEPICLDCLYSLVQLGLTRDE